MKPSLFFIDSIDEIKKQLEAGAKIKEKMRGATPLFYVDDPEAAEFLISNGADVNQRAIAPLEGDTPLFAMSIRGNVDVAKVLLKHNADVNAKNKMGETALFYAKTAEIVELLIENGADIHIRDENGNTPLHSEDIQPAAAEVLVKRGLDVNAKNNMGQTPLQTVDSQKMADFLIAHGAIVA